MTHFGCSVPKYFYAFATERCQWRRCFWAVHPACSSIHSSAQILLPWYLMNSLRNLNETYNQYSLVPVDDLLSFWRSKVRLQQAVKVDGSWSPSSSLCILNITVDYILINFFFIICARSVKVIVRFLCHLFILLAWVLKNLWSDFSEVWEVRF